MKVVVAIDSFKGSMTSMEAGHAAEEGILRVHPDAEVLVKPLADGGEGTVDALVEGLGGDYVTARVKGPMGPFVTARYGIMEDENEPTYSARQTFGAASFLSVHGNRNRVADSPPRFPSARAVAEPGRSIVGHARTSSVTLHEAFPAVAVASRVNFSPSSSAANESALNVQFVPPQATLPLIFPAAVTLIVAVPHSPSPIPPTKPSKLPTAQAGSGLTVRFSKYATLDFPPVVTVIFTGAGTTTPSRPTFDAAVAAP